MGVLTVRHWIATSPSEVWRAYTTPELFALFFSPEGLSIPLESVVVEMCDGGRFECTMVVDETGERDETVGIIVEVDEPNRFVGQIESMGIVSVQSFVDDAGGTLITVEQQGLPDEVVLDPAVLEAFRSSYRKLGRVLAVHTENRD
jgi:uncharacterized protein YndB with AHSA1/START domain